jgi:bacillithiol biosynthesis cysteine-adding enzyme BshC
LHLFGKTFTWENDESGATGMMQTATLQPVLEEIKSVLGESENAQKITAILENCFTEYLTYGKAMMAFTNELFQEYGVIVTSPNHAKLKRLFIPIIKDELQNNASKSLVEGEIAKKEAAGFGGQAHVRDINLFYLMPNLRERIVFEDGVYKVLNTDYEFTPETMMTEVDNHPERFSPNVILRPVYQEAIFPNLAYIGGGGELSYWAERQPQFEHFNVPFPMLVRRNSVLWVDKSNAKKIEKLGLTIDDLFGEVEELIKDYVKANTDEELSLENAKIAVNQAFEKILVKATAIDPTLKKTVLGEQTKQINAINALESRLLKAEKRNHEVAINQIRTLKDKLFAGNGLQERYDNFLPFYLKHGDGFIQTLKENLAPLNMDFAIIFE